MAIYDLDRTITKRATFTPFLVFAAQHLAPWRLMLLPVWIAAMLGYRAGICSRTALKRFGLRLMTGRAKLADLEAVGVRFAAGHVNADGLMLGTLRMIEEDRNDGARIVIATAAFEFYAREFARLLDVEDVIATAWDGQDIPGGNCYGANKRDRFLVWCQRTGLDLTVTDIRFVSDSFADAPLFDLAHHPIFITARKRSAARARLRGWEVRDPTC